MVIAYLDESGDLGVLPTASSPVQPLFCLLGLAIPEEALQDFTLRFLELKSQFFPGKCSGRSRLERLLVEVKGADLRKPFRDNDKGKQAHHAKFIDRLLDLVQGHQGRIFGRVWIKPINGIFAPKPIYTASVQEICTTFHDLLVARKKRGFVIADSRLHTMNSSVSFSVFTQRFAKCGNPHPRILESPVFAHSENHAMLQVCDLLCSALVFPMASFSFCTGHVTSVHVSPGYAILKTRYGARLRTLQHLYQGPQSRWHGGITVSDPLAGRPSKNLFI